MNCCVNCFRDAHIRTTIQQYGVVGDCDFCTSKSTSVFDISNKANPITDMMVSLLQIYSVSDNVNSKLLKTALHKDWDIFNAGAELILALTKKLCEESFASDSDVFTKNVSIPQLEDRDFLHEFCVVRGYTWEEFSNSIKFNNRFHNSMFNADVFASFLSIITKNYPSGTQMYRARISSDKGGFLKESMGAPPKDRRTAGRINPEGVGILYLSSDPITVLNEVRASVYDYITIGTFQCSRDIKVVNLSGVGRTSPFLYVGEFEKFAANRKVFHEIAAEIAKPLRRSDSLLSYLPTQYIAEFIKSQGYDGVEYDSTLSHGGLNIAIFDEELFECVETQTVEVSKISYETAPAIALGSNRQGI